MKVRVWGSRGSIASPGPDTVRYGGNTSCVEVRNAAGAVLVLDIGTGARLLGQELAAEDRPVHVLLTHLHMDHIQGAGFFAPIYQQGREVHVWGPRSSRRGHAERLGQYLSSPLFPVNLTDLEDDVTVHDLAPGRHDINGFVVAAEPVCHPGHTFGLRVEADGVAVTYIPDHEPALAHQHPDAPHGPDSGQSLARGCDLLIHDCQYSDEDYPSRIGWGHSSLAHVTEFVSRTGVRRLMPFHFEPAYDDDRMDELMADLRGRLPGVEVIAGCEGVEVEVTPCPR